MGSYLQIAFGVVLAAGFAAVFFIIGFLGADWYYTGHPTLVGLIDTHPTLITYSISKAFRLGDYGRLQAAFLTGLLGLGGVPLLAYVAGKNSTTDARFMTISDVQKAGLTKGKGVFIGRAGGQFWNILWPHTNIRSGRFNLFRKTMLGGLKLRVTGDDVGGFVIGPPRSGKGAALIIPNALMWPHSLVILDLRGETYDATAGHRSKFSRVIRFSPADRDGNTEFYNPLQFISLDNAQRDIDLRNMAAALFPSPPGSSDPYWVNDARLLFIGITSYVLETDTITDEDRTLDTVLKILNGEEEPIAEFLNRVRDGDAGGVSRFTLSTLAPYAEMSEKQFSGVHSGVRTGMAPFLNERIRKATSKSSFDIRTLKQEKISLYLDVRLEQIGSLGPLFNVLLTQMMNFMSEAIPRPGEHQCLVLLDEFQNLGKLENITQMATLLGGNGVAIWFFVQSLKSVDLVYKEEGRKTLINSARVQIFFGAQDADDLRYVSEQLGEKTETQKDVTRTYNSLFDTMAARSVHQKTIRRPLMRPDEIRTMDKTKVIILPRGQSPILGTRNFYFSDVKLAKVAFISLPKPKPTLAAPKPEFIMQALSASPKITPALVFAAGPNANETIKRGSIFAAKAASTSNSARSHLESSNSSRAVGQDESQTRKLQTFYLTNVKPSASQALATTTKKSDIPPSAPDPHTQATKMDFAEMVAKAKVSSVDDDKAMRIASLFITGEQLGRNSQDKPRYNQMQQQVEEIVTNIIGE